jgi:hypothetical protein
MALYGVIDLHARNHWLAIINEQNRKIIKKFPNVPQIILRGVTH